MEFRAVKGTRDFYPEAMRLRRWIVDAWRRVSVRNGFEEYDCPIFEYLDLFTIKSGEEIASQLFSFTDRGGRDLAIRPEITPSLARMVNARVNSLRRPIKWFSVPRLCRAENPQKGRLREFFQWNVDVIGSGAGASGLADAECIFVAVDFLREVGLGPRDVCVRIGSRPLTVSVLASAGVGPEATSAALAALDKRPRVSEADFVKLAKDAGLDDRQIKVTREFQDCSTIGQVRQAVEALDVQDAIEELDVLLANLDAMGIGDYCKLDMRIVRGLAYYTGIVYEIFDAGQSLRALAGGGRYDNLLEVLGGPEIAATGFGMGDVVLGILLEEKGKVPDLSQKLDFFVIDAEAGTFDRVMKVVGALRSQGLSAEFSYKRQGLAKQLNQANRCGAERTVILRRDGLAVKDMATGGQQDRRLEDFLSDPCG